MGQLCGSILAAFVVLGLVVYGVAITVIARRRAYRLLRAIHLAEQALTLAYRETPDQDAVNLVHQRLDGLKFDASITGEMPTATYETDEEEDDEDETSGSSCGPCA
jgi:hypothetical protein